MKIHLAIGAAALLASSLLSTGPSLAQQLPPGSFRIQNDQQCPMGTRRVISNTPGGVQVFCVPVGRR